MYNLSKVLLIGVANFSFIIYFQNNCYSILSFYFPSCFYRHGCMRVEKIRATYCTPMRGHTISSSTYSICKHEFLKLLTSNQATWSVFNKFWYRCKHSLCSRRRHFHNTNLNYLPFRGTLLLDNGGSRGAMYISFRNIDWNR